MSSELNEVALLEVVQTDPKLGCLLDAGTEQLLPLPASELPFDAELWPIVGDHVYILKGVDGLGKPIAIVAGEHDFEPLTFMAPDAWHNQWLEGTVYNPLDIGTFILCEGGVLGFGVMGLIHETERTRPLRLGEKVRVRVTFVREDGRINCSMNESKEISRDKDAARILAYLQTCRDGAMPYSDETPAELIRDKFALSKAAFKRALGKLMKENKVEQSGSWTQLTKPE